ncbi:MAG TPA: hypothetical protein EYP11_01575 [Aquificaceae bacterium]|nr:hypothetical protein [Aquificaceae bacterium]
MAAKKDGEKIRGPSMEEEVQELRRSVLGALERLLPPKEVREEVLRNVYTIELSFLKIIKTLLDHQVEVLEKKVERKPGKKKAQKIEIEG